MEIEMSLTFRWKFVKIFRLSHVDFIDCCPRITEVSYVKVYVYVTKINN